MSESDKSGYNKMKDYLIELGVYEEGMNIDDMVDLAAAIQNSNKSAREEENIRQSSKEISINTTKTSENKRVMERKYTIALERRMPWSLFPTPEQLSVEQRAKVMAAYKQQINICRYRKARSSAFFTEWNNCIFTIPIAKYKHLQELKGVHHTRSGRTLKSTPHYIDNTDTEDSDAEDNVRKSKKKIRKLSNNESMSRSSLFYDTGMSSTSNSIETTNTQPLLIKEPVESNGLFENIHFINKEYTDVVSQLSPPITSPKITASTMTVVAQVHRDALAPGNYLRTPEETTEMCPRKKIKRLNASSEEE